MEGVCWCAILHGAFNGSVHTSCLTVLRCRRNEKYRRAKWDGTRDQERASSAGEPLGWGNGIDASRRGPMTVRSFRLIRRVKLRFNSTTPPHPLFQPSFSPNNKLSNLACGLGFRITVQVTSGRPLPLCRTLDESRGRPCFSIIC